MPYWETKYLRLFWDENGESTEFHMRYNLSYPGFWISSGPENGGKLKIVIYKCRVNITEIFTNNQQSDTEDSFLTFQHTYNLYRVFSILNWSHTVLLK